MSPRAEPGAAQYVPDDADLATLQAAVQGCRGCPLYRDATQAVFGDGPERARAVLVGEQPGDKEDLSGEPFVGPAGTLLDKALREAGMDRAQLYLTNAVKHFKFERRDKGKARIHRKPGRTEVVACSPWLAAEITLVRPELVICLGATAAQAVMGTAFKLTQQRGALVRAESDPYAGQQVLATIHPSAVLRSPDRDEAFQSLVADLRVAARALEPELSERSG